MICRICDSQKLVPVLDLGLQPWANHFLKKEEVGREPKYPLFVFYCLDCACVQLDYTVPKEVMFSDHTYVSGTTKTLSRHFENLAAEIDGLFLGGVREKSVLDIGSNDGTQLRHYQQLGYSALGVESCGRVAEMAKQQGVATVVDFFNADCAKKIGRQFNLINASGVFFHLEELHSAAEGVRICLREDGVFVIQFLYMKSIVENLAFDQIYHEHLLYYTVRTVEKLLNRHGMEGFDGYLAPIHGGSIILFAGHKLDRHGGRRPKSERWQALVKAEDEAGANELKWYQQFAERVEQMKKDTVDFLAARKAAGKTIYGFGAPVKGNTFLNYCGIGTQYVDYLVEKNPLRKGLYSPGMHIPLVLEDEVKKQPDLYLVLAWNFKEEILRNNQDLIKQGVEFFFPVNPEEKRPA